MVNWAVLDIETSTNTSFGRKGNPFDPDNYIVSVGVKYRNGDRVKTHILRDEKVIPDGYLHNVDVIIGVNLKFDLLYLWNNPELKEFFKRGGRIYDCQYAFYLTQAQQPKFPSMNSMADHYGLPQKPDKIKEYWENGVDTIDIPMDELLDYLDHDLDTTEGIFKAVAKESAQKEMVPLIREHMEGLCATIEMEYNGLKVDVVRAEKDLEELEIKRNKALENLSKYLPDLPGDAEFNWGSGKHLSALLFGGEVPYDTKEQVYKDGEPVYYLKDDTVPCLDSRGEPIYYKSGQRKGEPKTKRVKVYDKDRPKYKKTRKTVEIEGITTPDRGWELASGGYQTTEEVLKTLADRGIKLVDDLLHLKGYDKLIGTYYRRGKKGMLNLVQKGDLIHHSLHNVTTDTGRLSSSKPNAQNCPPSVKSMFVSRFDDGLVGELDYGQLEVVIQAWLTKDQNLIRDVNNGVDLHCKRLAAKRGEDYEFVLHKCKVEEDSYYNEERRKAKSFSFQRSYGAGANAISKDTGMPVEEVEAFIEAEDAEYPMIALYNEWVAQRVESSAEYADNLRMFGWHPAPTNKRYGFTQMEAPDFLKRKGILWSFSPTQMKNYSVQGEAGVVVIGILGRLWRKFVETDNFDGKALLINTVHDCVWLDMRESVKDEVLAKCKEIMLDVPSYYGDVYGIDMPVKFSVDVEVGDNFGDGLHHDT